jgi:small-conductance mechanosensitive channel
MDPLLHAVRKDLLDPRAIVGALFWGVVFVGLAAVTATLIRRAARRLEPRLSDVTGFRFVSAFAQLLTYLVAFILYAHLVPELRALGTALLAGVSVVSVVFGLAAQNTLGNLVAGLSLVLYRPVRVGDRVQTSSPKGLITATVELVSLGYTILRDTEENAVIVPNSVMISSVVIRLGPVKPEPDPTVD